MADAGRLRVLVTNDDGVHGPGIHHLARAMVDAGHDVVVAAPQEDLSGASASLGRFHPDNSIEVTRHEIPGVPELESYGVDGPPALCVIAARLEAFGPPPDVVVAGINPGHNTGRATMHSGTVGAALTAANFGVRGAAFSTGASERPHWEAAAALAQPTVEWLLAQPEGTVLNVNVPDVPFEEIQGVRWADLAPFGTVQATMVGADEGLLQMELRETEDELPADSDTALVLEGFVAVTPLVGVRGDLGAMDRPTPLADVVPRGGRRTA
jgi:5'-nucleotidase